MEPSHCHTHLIPFHTQGKHDGRPDDSECPRFISELCDQFVEENGTLTLQVEVAGGLIHLLCC